MSEIELNEHGELDLPKSEQSGQELGREVKTSQHSFFEDDEGENLESGAILIDGQKVTVRELSATEMAAYSQGEKEIAEMLRALAQVKNDEEAEAQSEAIRTRQIALYDAAIEAGVSSWELTRPDKTPVPCTPEFKKKLRLSKKVELSEKIVRRSATGRAFDSFLGSA
jgi:hypothetical protein